VPGVGIILKIRLDNGQIVATNQWGNPGIDGYGNIIFDDNGNFFVSGQGSPPDQADTDDKYLVAKHRKSDLANVWRRLDVPPATGFIAAAEAWGGLSYAPGSTPGNGRLVAGGWYITASGANGFLAVYNALNNTTPTRQNAVVVASSGTRADWVLDNAVDNNGNIYAVGFTTGGLQGQPIGQGDAYIVKYRPDLTSPTFVQVGTNKNDCFRKLEIDATNGRLYAAGYTYGNYSTPNYNGTNADASLRSGDVLIQQFDLSLNRLAARQFGTVGEDRSLCALQSSTLCVGGMTEGAMVAANQGPFDGFVVNLRANDLTTLNRAGSRLAAPSPEPTPIQSRFFPNPTTDELFIELSEFSTASYAIVDLTGQVLLTNSLKATKTALDLSHLPTGIYLMRLFVDGQTTTRQLMKQ
jgi:hypothetical protein